MSEGKIRLHMTAKEIVDSYRNALDPKAQVKILAELNAVSPDVIREALTGCGVELPKERGRRDKKRKFDREEAARLYEQGYADAEIAKALGVGKTAVSDWRKENGLLPAVDKRGGARSKKRKEETVMEDQMKNTEISARPAEERERVETDPMSLAAVAGVIGDVLKAFPGTALRMSGGVPTGMKLTVRWNAEAEITETVLTIE